MYPKTREVDWSDFASRAKTVLLLHGTAYSIYDTFYADDFIEIRFTKARPDGVRSSSFLEVIRKKMPEHPKEHLHNNSNPVYMESSGECIRVHGEGIYIYDHILFLSLGGQHA